MSKIIHACSPVPPPPSTNSTNGVFTLPTVGRAVISKSIWPIGKQINYAYLDGAFSNKALAVDATIQTWSTYANISFTKTTNIPTADIRISFLGSGSWSAVGEDALTIMDTTQATINLGWIEDANPPSAEDRGTILHEFGHVLGMMHEQQSPARGEKIHLNELAVYNYYRPLLNNDNSLVKSQVIDVYNLSGVSNFSRMDLVSIMMYFMPASLNEEGIAVPPNLELSQLDKAFITLTYPRQDADAIAAGSMKVLDALNVVSVPNDISANILDLLSKNDLNGVRTTFSTYNLGVMSLVAANPNVANSVNPADAQQNSIQNVLGNVMNDPFFKSILKNMVNNVFNSRGIPAVNDVPGADSQNDVLDTLGAFATNPTFAQSINDFNTFFSGVAPSPTSTPVVSTSV